MARLPIPGSDNGNWGTILNDYLQQALKPDGQLRDDVVTANNLAPNSVTNAALASNAVDAAIIADGSITETLLAPAVQTKLNAGAGTTDWSTITNKPSVIAAGATAAAAKAALSLVKADVGLDNVDNTSDATKNAATATLANKTLSNPRIDSVYDTNGKLVFDFSAEGAGAVNNVFVGNAATGNAPYVAAGGSDTNVDLNLSGQGTGKVRAGGVEVATISGSQTLTNKTLTAPMISLGSYIASSDGNPLIGSYGVPASANYLQVANAQLGSGPIISSVGQSADIDINLNTKGTGQVKINGSPISADADLVHKTGSETIAGYKNFTDTVEFSQMTYAKEMWITPTNGTPQSAAFSLDNDNGQVWQFTNNSGGAFAFWDQTNSKAPFAVQADSPDQALVINGGGVFVRSGYFTMNDDADPTKQAEFQLSDITSGTVRSFSLPDADTTVVGTDVAQTLSNKTLDGNDNTFTNIPISSVSAAVAGSVNGTPTSLTLWKGTQAQYDALGTYDTNTVYMVT